MFLAKSSRKDPSPWATMGKSSGERSHPSAGSWAAQRRGWQLTGSTGQQKPSHLLALLTDPTHSQGVFPGETRLTRSYRHTPALRESLSANSKINVAVLHGQQGWAESCSHVAAAEAHVPLLRESGTLANILNFPSPPSFPPLPLPPSPTFYFFIDPFP